IHVLRLTKSIGHKEHRGERSPCCQPTNSSFFTKNLTADYADFADRNSESPHPRPSAQSAVNSVAVASGGRGVRSVASSPSGITRISTARPFNPDVLLYMLKHTMEFIRTRPGMKKSPRAGSRPCSRTRRRERNDSDDCRAPSPQPSPARRGEG